MRPEALCGLLAEPDRLRVYSAVVLGADLPSAVADRTGLPARVVVAALRRYLIDEELLARDNAVYWRTGGYVEV